MTLLVPIILTAPMVLTGHDPIDPTGSVILLPPHDLNGPQDPIGPLVLLAHDSIAPHDLNGPHDHVGPMVLLAPLLIFLSPNCRPGLLPFKDATSAGYLEFVSL